MSKVDLALLNTITSIIGHYVALKKRGQNYMGLCPFHSEDTPSFTVSPKKELWHCFGCGLGGDKFSFLRRIGNDDPEIEKIFDEINEITP